jgi:hypothetical protein
LSVPSPTPRPTDSLGALRQILVVATHDSDLALAARSFGFEVRGV